MTHLHHDEHHHHAGSSRALLLSVGLTLGYSAIEAAAGWWAGSLALLGDAAHMLTDSLALGLAAGAAAMAARPPSARHSYGYGRLEILATLINAALMIGLVATICAEAVQRLFAPLPVGGTTVTAVALIGLGINLLAAWLLSGNRENLNVRAALLHVMGDLLGSVAALLSGVIILSTGWTRIDPILSLLIAVLILFSSLSVLREALLALMEGVPRHLNLSEIGEAIAGTPGVEAVHDLHVWSLSGDRAALSAHLVIRELGGWIAVMARVQGMLHERFGIAHTTLQPEPIEQQVPVGAVGRHPRRKPQDVDRPAGRATTS
jgi:cobalt-zinc-cadmium efflux system protein